MAGEEQFIIGLIFSIAFMFIAISVMTWALDGTKRDKSRRYRKQITDMYIAGKVRNLAKNDGVNLEEEEKRYLKALSFNKKQMIADLDDKIELDMMEELEKKAEAKK